MLLQGDQAFASRKPEKIIEQLEQVIVGGTAVGRAFEARQNAFDQVDEHLLRRHDHQGAQGRAADRENFRGMDQCADLAARHDESGQHTPHDNDASGDNEHEFFSGYSNCTASVAQY